MVNTKCLFRNIIFNRIIIEFHDYLTKTISQEDIRSITDKNNTFHLNTIKRDYNSIFDLNIVRIISANKFDIKEFN